MTEVKATLIPLSELNNAGVTEVIHDGRTGFLWGMVDTSSKGNLKNEGFPFTVDHQNMFGVVHVANIWVSRYPQWTEGPFAREVLTLFPGDTRKVDLDVAGVRVVFEHASK